MFDLAYTLESYDLVPATEGVLKSIGKGVKAIIDFIIKKLKGAIAFLTGKKKEIAKLSENKDRIPENYNINREKASQAKSYSTELTQSYVILTKYLRGIWTQTDFCIRDVEWILKSNDTMDSDIDQINEDIDKINSYIDNNILPVLNRLNRAKEPLMYEGHVESANNIIARISKSCKKWEDLKKVCDKRDLSNEAMQAISSVAQANTRVVDVTVKVMEALSRVTTYNSAFAALDKRSPLKIEPVIKSK